ncbi:MAG: DNA recombination protein RmuC [Bacteroidaceae bacterium]|nr:DNA recombination protein RmuC [Bacteroidaceae bacterium]
MENYLEYIYLIVGIAVGALVAYLAVRSRSAALAALLDAEKQDHAEDEQRSAQALETAKQEAEERMAALKADFERQQTAIREQMTTLLEAQKQEAKERREQDLSELKQSYEVQLRLFKAEMKTATDQLLKERAAALQKDNSEQMDLLFRPLKDNIQRMEKSMTENRDMQSRNSAAFEKTMQMMMEKTNTLGEKADRLSNALQRKNKTAGNWGELILTELLESQGLQQGVHFDAQQTMKDEAGHSLKNEDTGARMIPDVILHLADNRDVIIDAKMSLTAFVDYQNAEDEESREEAAKRHLESVRAHIRELTTKKYTEYIKKPRVSSDFVIMFVPIEGALQLAMSQAPELWREAFDKHVFLVGGQTLIAALRIIDLTWVNVQQERNTQLIMDEARKLVERVAQFYTSFESVGKKLAEAQEAYRSVQDKVKDGRLSILGAGQKLESLGIRGKKALPELTGE